MTDRRKKWMIWLSKTTVFQNSFRFTVQAGLLNTQQSNRLNYDGENE